MPPQMSDDDDAEQCCGSGCNNCILDVKKRKDDDCPPYTKEISLDHYRPFTIVNIQPISATIIRFRLQHLRPHKTDHVDEPAATYLCIPIGHHVMIRCSCKVNNDAKHDAATLESYLSRSYTPITVEADQFEILVRLELHGAMSEYWRRTQLGDIYEVKGSYGNFKWVPNRWQRLICICQGVAIAPMYRIVRSILDDDDDCTRITLLACFGGSTVAELPLRQELHDCRQYWNFESVIYMPYAAECHACAGECKCGCWHNEIVKRKRLDFVDLLKCYNASRNSTFTLLCGSNSFVHKIQELLAEIDCDGQIAAGERTFIFNNK